MTSILPESGASAAFFEAAIFDLDGLLIDSEPFWREAEIEVFGAAGMTLRESECAQTVGLRVDLVVQYWLERRPWDIEAFPPERITADVVARVIELIRSRGEPKPGVDHAVDLLRSHGLRLALASSSTTPVIEAALDRLGLGDTFEVVHSADAEVHSKPAPDVYLGAARRLGVEPSRCIALEDSVAGVRSAKAAGMACIRVPEPGAPPADADLELASLGALDADVLESIARTTRPSPTG